MYHVNTALQLTKVYIPSFTFYLGGGNFLQSAAKLKFTERISRQKIILIFNTYNILNLKEKMYSINKAYV